ncbi:MAG: hypothetical protein J6Q89_07160, partial [Clostridia bacterium]|nr:hypothetical protein [Clostridia bacterium]
PQNAYTIDNYKRNVNYSNVYEAIAEKAGESWEQLGFDVEYRGLNPDEYLVALKTRDFEVIGVNVLSGSVDAFSYLAPFAKEYSGTGIVADEGSAAVEELFNPHYSNIDDADYSKLINDALNAATRDERASILHQAESKLVELCPATMVFWYSRSFVANDKKISGYETDSRFGYVDFGKLELKKWRDVNAKEDAEMAAREGK